MSRSRYYHAREQRQTLLAARQRKGGLTLLELIAVLVVLAVLAAIAIPTFASVIRQSKDHAELVTLSSVQDEAMALAVANQNPTITSQDYQAALADCSKCSSGSVAGGLGTVAAGASQTATRTLASGAGTWQLSCFSLNGVETPSGCSTASSAYGQVTVEINGDLVGVAMASSVGDGLLLTGSSTTSLTEDYICPKLVPTPAADAIAGVPASCNKQQTSTSTSTTTAPSTTTTTAPSTTTTTAPSTTTTTVPTTLTTSTLTPTFNPSFSVLNPMPLGGYEGLGQVSCVPGTYDCIALDQNNGQGASSLRFFVTNDANLGASANWQSVIYPASTMSGYTHQYVGMGVTCPTTSFCAISMQDSFLAGAYGQDSYQDVYYSTNPFAFSGTSYVGGWTPEIVYANTSTDSSTLQQFPYGGPRGISCVNTSTNGMVCSIVTTNGYVFTDCTSSDTSCGVPTPNLYDVGPWGWSGAAGQNEQIPGAPALGGISCGTTSIYTSCAESSTSGWAYVGNLWTPNVYSFANISNAGIPDCPSSNFCYWSNGSVLDGWTAAAPTAISSESIQASDTLCVNGICAANTQLMGLSCWSNNTCFTQDFYGVTSETVNATDMFATQSGTEGAARWFTTTVNAGTIPFGISCPLAETCVVTGGFMSPQSSLPNGTIAVTTNAFAVQAFWSATQTSGTGGITSSDLYQVSGGTVVQPPVAVVTLSSPVYPTAGFNITFWTGTEGFRSQNSYCADSFVGSVGSGCGPTVDLWSVLASPV